MSLVVVGSVAFDTIENSYGRVERALGGSAVYASLVASRFCPVKLVGVVGEDFGAEHYRLLESRGIDLEGLESVPGGKTFFWEGRYGEDPNERDTITTELNVFESFSPKLPSGYLDSKFLFLGNIDPRLQLDVLEQFPERPKTACDTMNYWIEGTPEELRRVLEKVEILIINDSEARLLSGERNLVKTARSILALGPEVLVIKKGEHGAHLFTEDFQIISPAYPLEEVIDPTGAGDTFAGGFMGCLAGSGKLDETALRMAMAYGTVTASFTCEAFSVGRLEKLEMEDIQRRFDRLVDIARLR
jgi:sugar/nucleoside kinase (ribokinase family)